MRSADPGQTVFGRRRSKVNRILLVYGTPGQEARLRRIHSIPTMRSETENVSFDKRLLEVSFQNAR